MLNKIPTIGKREKNDEIIKKMFQMGLNKLIWKEFRRIQFWAHTLVFGFNELVTKQKNQVKFTSQNLAENRNFDNLMNEMIDNKVHELCMRKETAQ